MDGGAAPSASRSAKPSTNPSATEEEGEEAKDGEKDDAMDGGAAPSATPSATRSVNTSTNPSEDGDAQMLLEKVNSDQPMTRDELRQILREIKDRLWREDTNEAFASKLCATGGAASFLSASHASRGMASGTWPKPGRGARWVILAIHTCIGHLLRLKRASRRPQGQRSCDSSKLHPMISPGNEDGAQGRRAR